MQLSTAEKLEQSANQVKFTLLQRQLEQSIIGQQYMLERMLIALLADGHILVEGAPGLAKTRAVNSLSQQLQGEFKRIQFTPDLLPSDLTGTEIFRPQTAEFSFRKGPLFNNLILADEINRAPAKVQSALLEAMAERQISASGQTFDLPKLFLVMATQNPIEQEGTYPLPEAQLDRFLLHVNVDYPSAENEKKILQAVRDEVKSPVTAKHNVLSEQSILDAREEVLEVHLSPQLEDYLIALILATRNPDAYGEEFVGLLEFGASPRATLALDRCARAKAWLHNRQYVTPDDIQEMFFDVARHRIGLSYAAEAKGISKDQLLNQLVARVAVP